MAKKLRKSWPSGLKIAFLSLSYGEVERGSEVFIREITSRLKKYGHKVDVISGSQEHGAKWSVLWRFYLDPRGIKTCLFTLKNLPGIWREKYDVVVPADGGWQALWVRVITWLYGGKVVISGQSGVGWDDRINLFSLPDAFVAISKRARDWAKKFAPFVKSLYIPDGVDLQKFRPGGNKFRHNLPGKVIVSVAALISKKRHADVINAVSRLDGVSLLIVGSGPLEKELRNMGEKLLGNRFLLTSVFHNKMPEIYRSADLFSLVSMEREAFGIVYAEALASGLPIVALKDSIRQEIVGDAGVLIDNSKTDEYPKALGRALKTNWGDKPRRQAEKFDWDKIAKQYEKLFLDLCQK